MVLIGCLAACGAMSDSTYGYLGVVESGLVKGRLQLPWAHGMVSMGK